MKKNFFISFAVLALILFVFEKTGWDIKLQDCFFDGGWLISKNYRRFFIAALKSLRQASVPFVCFVFCFRSKKKSFADTELLF